MKTHLIIGFLLSAGAAHAQSSEAYWRTDLTTTPTERQAIVSTIADAGAGTTSDATTAVINQSGAGNDFTFVGANGNTGNQITFTQDGNNNRLNFELEGSNNTYTFGQNGNRNVLNLQNVQTTGARLEVQQNGNGNRLESDGSPFSSTSIPLKITQTGGMQLIISSKP